MRGKARKSAAASRARFWSPSHNTYAGPRAGMRATGEASRWRPRSMTTLSAARSASSQK